MSDYHPFVPPMGKARYFGLTHSEVIASLPPQRLEGWKARLASLRVGPFRGITTEGQVVPGLFALRDEGAPTAEILAAVAMLLDRLTPEQLKTVKHPIDSIERRQWVNEVPRFERYGIWLDEVTPAVREAALGLLRASLSAAGYEKSRNVMKLNGLLGELVGAPVALGEFCYQMHIFGEPSATEPWGWQLYGHHFCLTCFVVGTQMTLTPTFMGAEPRYADTGPDAGIRLFDDEERIGLDLVRGLSTAQQRKAIIVPYEGVSGAELDPRQKQVMLDLTERFLSTLPPGPLRARMSDVEWHLAQTPNGNDYGMDLLRLHYETAPHHQK